MGRSTSGIVGLVAVCAVALLLGAFAFLQIAAGITQNHMSASIGKVAPPEGCVVVRKAPAGKDASPQREPEVKYPQEWKDALRGAYEVPLKDIDQASALAYADKMCAALEHSCLPAIVTPDSLYGDDGARGEKELVYTMLKRALETAQERSDTAAFAKYMAGFVRMAVCFSNATFGEGYSQYSKCAFKAIEFMEPLYLSGKMLPEPLLLELLPAMKAPGIVEKVIQGETYCMLANFDRWRQRTYRKSIEDHGLYWGTRDWIWAAGPCEVFFNLDEEYYLQCSQAFERYAAMPYYEASREMASLEGQIATLNEMKPVSQWAARTFPNVMRTQAELEAGIDKMWIAFHCIQMYANGAGFPKDLAELETVRGIELPLNPLSGEPYRLGQRNGNVEVMGTPNNMTLVVRPPVQAQSGTPPPK